MAGALLTLASGLLILVLIVSEERGSMRIALNGRLGPDLTPTELREQLRETFRQDELLVRAWVAERL